MAKTMTDEMVSEIYEATSHLLRFPETRMWIDYDKKADVLYISFRRPQRATESIMLKGRGLLMRYRDNQLVGITVLDASRRMRRVETGIEEPKAEYKIHRKRTKK